MSDIDGQYQKVCVVGAYTARAAYGGNAIGQTITIGGESIYHRRRAGSQCQQTTDQEGSDDDMIFVPYTTAQRMQQDAAPAPTAGSSAER